MWSSSDSALLMIGKLWIHTHPMIVRFRLVYLINVQENFTAFLLKCDVIDKRSSETL